MVTGCTNADRELRTGTYLRHLLRGWVDTAIERRADYPRRGYYSTTARQYWPSWRRDYSVARACIHSGVNRCADTIWFAVRLHATAGRDSTTPAARGTASYRYC